ncbi:hypothetical protein BDZ89DRAFT_433334 [Hymenopellis radicata]|nr:hypothetical protein BDZ89DRAFT_433334 [Hymenopellis radicata]
MSLLFQLPPLLTTMANITPAALSFKFDPSFHRDWPASDAEDHAESLLQQWGANAQQGRENPWYGMYQGNAIPKLCAVWSGDNSNLRLESAPVAELYYDTTLQPDELARITDPDYLELPDDRQDTQPDPVPHPVSRELKTLLQSAQALAPSGSKKDRRDNAARKKDPVQAPVSQSTAAPDSNSSTASVSAPKKVRIVRATDGMVFARGKLSYLREKLSIPDPIPTVPEIPSIFAVPTIPVISLELKVPLWTGSTYLINETLARNTLNRALPQIVQHAQFVFHSWKHITVTWALGVCGKYVMFYKFERSNTPEIEPVLISSGEYYVGTRRASEVPSDISDVLDLVDSDGKYTTQFQEWWRDVMVNAEQQYAHVNLVNLTTQ